MVSDLLIPSFIRPPVGRQTAGFNSLVEKTSFASNTSGSPAVKRGPRLRCSNRRKKRSLCQARLAATCGLPLLRPFDRMCFLFTMSDIGLAPSLSSKRRLTFELDLPEASLSGFRRPNETDLHRTRVFAGRTKEHRAVDRSTNQRSAEIARSMSAPADAISDYLGEHDVENPSGGARRDRTDDLMLAKHALSQLSYGPVRRQSAMGSRQ